MIVEVLVKPGSSKGPLVVAPSGAGDESVASGIAFDSSDDRAFTVYVREKAHDNEANEAVVKCLAKYFGVAKSCVILVGGGKSKRKKFEIVGR